MVKLDLMLKKSLPVLPETAGVYIFSNVNKVIYIGKAINLKRRVNSYFDLHLLEKTQKMVDQATSLKFIKVESELEALLLEAKLIKKYQPHYNIISKDDKHPLYIVITKEKFPRVLSVRKLIANSYSLIASFGPFPSSTNVKWVLKMIRRVIPYSDHKIGKRPCLYSHIGLCNPCPNTIGNNTEIKIYNSNIRRVKLILAGKFNLLKNTLSHEMINYSNRQMFEEAKIVKDKLTALEYITRPQISVNKYLENPNLYEDQRKLEIVKLQNILHSHVSFSNLKSLHRIECFDIAHLQGVSATASMVVFIDGVADKSLYRHFKIRQPNRQSDFDSMNEIAVRRAKHFSDWGIPDLIIVDGSIGQINKFKNNIKEIPIVGIAKNPDRLVVNSDLKIRLQGLTLQLVARMRDEAHRFARRYHKKLLLNRESII